MQEELGESMRSVSVVYLFAPFVPLPKAAKSSYKSGLLPSTVSSVQIQSDSDDFEDVICFETGLCYSSHSLN